MLINISKSLFNINAYELNAIFTNTLSIESFCSCNCDISCLIWYQYGSLGECHIVYAETPMFSIENYNYYRLISIMLILGHNSLSNYVLLMTHSGGILKYVGGRLRYCTLLTFPLLKTLRPIATSRDVTSYCDVKHPHRKSFTSWH